jgi:hypothetical protein
MNFSLFNREFEHLAPSQRRTFQSLGESWATTISNSVAARLATKQEEAA